MGSSGALARSAVLSGRGRREQGAFYLFSGWGLTPGADGRPHRKYLNDAFRYDPKAEAGNQVAACLGRPLPRRRRWHTGSRTSWSSAAKAASAATS